MLHLIRAKYFKLLADASARRLLADQYASQHVITNTAVKRQEALVMSIYNTVDQAAKKGSMCVFLPHDHELWASPDIRDFFRQKGFQVCETKRALSWMGPALDANEQEDMN